MSICKHPNKKCGYQAICCENGDDSDIRCLIYDDFPNCLKDSTSRLEREYTVTTKSDEILVIEYDPTKIDYEFLAGIYPSVKKNFEFNKIIALPKNMNLKSVSKESLESCRNIIDELLKQKTDEMS